MSGSRQRGMAILELLATTPHPLPLRDIAQSVNGPPTTVHRILGILAEAGFINQVKDNGDYYLSLKLASLGLIGLANTRSEEHTSELQSLMRSSYAGFCLQKKTYLLNHNK